MQDILHAPQEVFQFLSNPFFSSPIYKYIWTACAVRTWWVRRVRLRAAAVVVPQPCDSPSIDKEIRAALGLHRAVTVGIADPVDCFPIYKDVRAAGNRRRTAGVRIADPDNGWHIRTPYGFTRK